MLSAEQRKPLAAFVMVFAAACLIMGQGLRTHVLDVLVGSGAPRQLIAALAPDMVLGQALERKPRVLAQAPPTRPRESTMTVRTFDVVVAGGRQSSPQPVQVGTTGNRPRGSSTKPSGHKPRHSQGAEPASATPVGSPAEQVPDVPVPAVVVPVVRTPKPAPVTANPVRGFSGSGTKSYAPTVTRDAPAHHVRASQNGDGHEWRGDDHRPGRADHHSDPGDDHGGHSDPGDDHGGHSRGGDDHGGHSRGDDHHGGHSRGDDDHHGHQGH